VAVLTGAGDRSFCTGADLVSSIPTLTQKSQSNEAHPQEFSKVMEGFDTWKPIIAGVNGYCIAGGVELMLSCDLCIACENAVFGLSEVRWGIIPGGGATQRLPRSVPLAMAMEMILTGNNISAQKALEIGLINKVVPLDALGDEIGKWVQTLLGCGPLALRAAKQAIVQGLDLPLNEGFTLEDKLFKDILKTEDAVEGPKAFTEKRQPVFRGK